MLFVVDPFAFMAVIENEVAPIAVRGVPVILQLELLIERPDGKVMHDKKDGAEKL